MASIRRIMSKFKCCEVIFLFVITFMLFTPLVNCDGYSVKVSYPSSLELPNPEQNVMPYEPVQYSVANISNNYRSSTKYHAKGMGHLYYLTNKFMNSILKKPAYPKGWLRVEESTGRIESSLDWIALGWHYGRLLLISVGVLLLAALVPVAGLIFCCCRCCAGRCGATPRPYDDRYDTCRRHIFGAILTSITVLILFGVVCSFVTNEQMEEGARSLPNSVRTSLYDTDLYINNTKLQVNTLLINNFNELETVLEKLLHRSGEIVKDRLGEISKATVLANLTSIVSGLRRIRADLDNIDSLTRPLQEYAVSLESALRAVRMSLLEKLETCRYERACTDFLHRYNITALSLEANFTQLPDVTMSLQNVSALLENNIEDEVLKGKDQFDRIKYNIQTSVDRKIPEISAEIRKAGRMLTEKSKNVTRLLEKLQIEIKRISYGPVDDVDQLHKQYAHYRYYIGVGVSSCLLVVLVCLVMGLLCGYCGHRPDSVYNDDCCDKGSASRSLILAVWLMLLSFSGLAILILIDMVTGSITDRLVCSSLKNPSDPNNAFDLIDKLANISVYLAAAEDNQKPTSSPPPLSTIIAECHRNSSIYRVLGLDMDSLSEYSSGKFNIPARVNQLADSIVLTSEIQIITPQAERQLRALAASPLNTINLTAYTSVLNDKITSIDLLQMATALNQTAARLPPSQAQVRTTLLTQAMYLEVHQVRQVAIMGQYAGWLHGNATMLSHHLRFNKSSLAVAVESMLSSVFSAQDMLNSRGPSIVKRLAGEFGEEFSKHIDTYLERVQNEAYTNVGRCWPVSKAYNATIVATCNAIVDPFNGFWLSCGWTVLLFLPAIILCVKLATLYMKSEPYPGPLVETEYLYDAYSHRTGHHHHHPNVGTGAGSGVVGAIVAERDTIPLANVEKKKKKKKKSAPASRYDGSVNYSAHLSRSERPPQSDRDWDLSGLPRYQTPPAAEYERPPPYYFPPTGNTSPGPVTGQ